MFVEATFLYLIRAAFGACSSDLHVLLVVIVYVCSLATEGIGVVHFVFLFVLLSARANIDETLICAGGYESLVITIVAGLYKM